LRNGVLDRQEYAVEIYRGLSPPVSQRHLDRSTQDANAGVGDHHVQAAKAPFGCFDDSRPGLFESHVLMQKEGLAARAADLCGGSGFLDSRIS
jgi:hypothetical protein